MNNAGIIYFESFANFNTDHYHDTMHVNLHSVVQLTKLAVPHLEKTKGLQKRSIFIFFIVKCI